MGDGFYRSKDPTNSIKLLKGKRYKAKPRKSNKQKIIDFRHLCYIYRSLDCEDRLLRGKIRRRRCNSETS